MRRNDLRRLSLRDGGGDPAARGLKRHLPTVEFFTFRDSRVYVWIVFFSDVVVVLVL